MPELRELVAASFDLGSPANDLRPIQVGSYESWRLDTARGSFMVKRLWRGQDPTWRREYETSMELERRALDAGLPTAIPIEPVRPYFGWATRIDDQGVWRAYEWLNHTMISAEAVDARWFGETLALLHKLYPLTAHPDSEWRWLGVYPPEQWRAWLDAAHSLDKPWAGPVVAHLDDIGAVTVQIRSLYEESTDHIVSHRDLGPWNVLRTSDGLRLIDWENAGPTAATVELGRAVLAFGSESPTRMSRLIEAYRTAGGQVMGRPQGLFTWQLTQQLSQITERIKISVGDLDPEDDPEPIWMNPSTIDIDIVDGTTTLRTKSDQLATAALDQRLR